MLVGTFIPDAGFAGMIQHGRSGLNQTLFRQYSASQGRWLSRDPLGESAGTNLYAYCGGDPINCVDPLGLKNYVAGTPEEAMIYGFRKILNNPNLNNNEFHFVAGSENGATVISDPSQQAETGGTALPGKTDIGLTNPVTALGHSVSINLTLWKGRS